MSKITETIYLLGTYLVAGFSLFLNFESIKNIIVFVLTVVLICIQIKIHVKKLKRENQIDKENLAKKNKDITATEKPQL